MTTSSSVSADRSIVTKACTPKSVDDKKGSIIRTPLSGMSSSLKERLKKCGRYHPATPPSSHRTTPTPGLTRTPTRSESDTLSMTSPQHQGTPTCHHRPSSVRAHPHSPTGTKRTLPQPRNILKEKSPLRNHCEKGRGNFDCISQTQTGHKTSVNFHDKEESKLFDTDDTREEICSGPENSSHKPQSEGLPVINTSSVMFGSEKKKTMSIDSEKKSVSDKQETMQESAVVTSDVDLVEAKKRLTAELAQQKEVLRKLHMVRTYRAKHDLLELQGLIDKWRSACQQAVLDLHRLTSDPRPSLTQLVCQLGIDQKLVCYNEEEECFEDN
ncbi:uncharacterized protein LOC143279519 [Babylonia areolata]|uniref:uncharacterized protein LOC143279519 n=1 Tax=Babylonia areolata TaxID=304850 RepID=UPI003FD137FD